MQLFAALAIIAALAVIAILIIVNGNHSEQIGGATLLGTIVGVLGNALQAPSGLAKLLTSVQTSDKLSDPTPIAGPLPTPVVSPPKQEDHPS